MNKLIILFLIVGMVLVSGCTDSGFLPKGVYERLDTIECSLYGKCIESKPVLVTNMPIEEIAEEMGYHPECYEEKVVEREIFFEGRANEDCVIDICFEQCYEDIIKENTKLKIIVNAIESLEIKINQTKKADSWEYYSLLKKLDELEDEEVRELQSSNLYKCQYKCFDLLKSREELDKIGFKTDCWIETQIVKINETICTKEILVREVK